MNGGLAHRLSTLLAIHHLYLPITITIARSTPIAILLVSPYQIHPTSCEMGITLLLLLLNHSLRSKTISISAKTDWAKCLFTSMTMSSKPETFQCNNDYENTFIANISMNYTFSMFMIKLNIQNILQKSLMQNTLMMKK